MGFETSTTRSIRVWEMGARNQAGHKNATSDPGASQLPPITVPTHLLTRYLRVRLGVSDGFLRWEVPRTLLGVVPAGVQHISVPVGDVESLRVHRVVRPFSLLVGAACIVVPLVLALWWAAVPLGIVGLWVVLVSLGPRLEVVTHRGEKRHTSVCFSHQIDAELYMAAVTDLAEQARERR